jgi:hypothetical protein
LGSNSKRKYSKSMLLDQSDLPGEGWRIIGERAWRTGMFGPQNDIWRRTHSVGNFTAVRSFDQPTAPRWLLIKVVPAASKQDAEDIAPMLMSLSTPNRRAKVTVTSEGAVGNVSVTGIANPWVYEQLTSGMSEGSTSSRYVAASVDDVAILISCSGYSDTWPWDEVGSIAARQAAKVRLHTQNTRDQLS